MHLTPVYSKARKHYPAALTEYLVKCEAVAKGGYGRITVYRSKGGVVEQGTTFELGDTAEYDSYNLKYTGKIVKITNKVVSITRYPGSNMAKTYRLSLYEFCWRNFKFNAVETAQYNANESMYI